jgi:bifunctional oligoribonuclease and PAP phosphatase NrnA
MSHKAPQWEEVAAAIHAAQTILIVTHIRPDGDAIGSALGLANALRQIGKSVTVADDDGVPDFLAWLPHADSVVKTVSGEWDLLISTDASDEIRTGIVGEYGRAHSKQVINLDHHETNTYFGNIYLVVPTAASATEIVFSLWAYMNIPLNYEIAQPLLVGLVTDTLGFRTTATTAQTLGVAQKLLQAGASLTEATQRSLDLMTKNELLLWKRVLPTVEVYGEVAEAVIRQSDLEALGIEGFSTGGIVGFLRQVQEVRIAVVFLEEPDGIKVSMRSKPGYDVASVALAVGGGGHKQAAGATLTMSLDEARAKLLPMLSEAAAKGQLQLG